MCTALPVYRGEIQCRLLGMAIEAFTPDGSLAQPGEEGELVCLKPFPCMPVGFWPLEGYGSKADVEGAKVRYQQAYFSEFKGVWCEWISLSFRFFLGRPLLRCWVDQSTETILSLPRLVLAMQVG